MNEYEYIEYKLINEIRSNTLFCLRKLDKKMQVKQEQSLFYISHIALIRNNKT